MGHVELQSFGVAAQLVELQVGLVVEQQIMHGPELALRGSALCCLCRVKRVRMDFLQWEMAIDKPYSFSEPIEK